MINFQSPSTVNAARAHVLSLRWRLAVWALFAIGAAIALGSAEAGISWFLVLALATGFDVLLGHSYLNARGRQEQNLSGALFVWGCLFSSSMFAAMPLVLAAQGGEPGRMLGVLMAASGFVRVTAFLSRARGIMFVINAPIIMCLLALPFVPANAVQLDPLAAAGAMGFGVLGFFAYVVRAALNHEAMLLRIESTHRLAKERQLEAEAQRAEAVEANRAKSEFLGVMTHELRTPLNAVINYAELIEEDVAAIGRPDLARDASRIEQSARHLLALIDQILSLTSVEAGRDAIVPREIDVREFVEEIAASFAEAAEARGNRISTRISSDAAVAFTDAGKLAVCVSALVSNAVKFTDNGFVAVNVQRQEANERHWLVVTVSDTGCGIAPEQQARIFKPFQQVDGSATREKDGMGLGLSVGQRLATRLGGEIGVRSELGAGSTFTLRIPLRLDQAGPAIRVAA